MFGRRKQLKPNYAEITQMERELGFDDGVADDIYLEQEIEAAVDATRVKAAKNPNWRENNGVHDFTSASLIPRIPGAAGPPSYRYEYSQQGSSFATVIPNVIPFLVSASIH